MPSSGLPTSWTSCPLPVPAQGWTDEERLLQWLEKDVYVLSWVSGCPQVGLLYQGAGLPPEPRAPEPHEDQGPLSRATGLPPGPWGASSRPHGTLGPQAAVWMSQGQISSCNLPHPTLALSASEGPPCKTGREPRAALWTLTLCSVALMLATERESTLRAGLPFTLLGAPLSNPRARSGA